MSSKENIYNECIRLIDHRFNAIQNNISDIQNNLLSETKSSAGDKHETGRAMLQLEREKAGVQLSEINKLRRVLHKVNLEHKPEYIGIGSLVYTSKANYFIAVSLGAIKIDDKLFYAISPQTPIGLLLMGKTSGDVIEFNGNTFTIERLE